MRGSLRNAHHQFLDRPKITNNIKILTRLVLFEEVKKYKCRVTLGKPLISVEKYRVTLRKRRVTAKKSRVTAVLLW